jgi:thymidylate synthase
MYLGLPFNIASVALLVYILAHITNNKPGYISIIIGEGYIYNENINDIKEQLNKIPYEPPTLTINKKYSNINDYKYNHFDLHNYKFH